MPDRSNTPPPWCPRCLALTEGRPLCAKCGLPQTGREAARLRIVVYRLHEIRTAEQALAQERSALEDEQSRLLHQLEHAPAVPYDVVPAPEPGAGSTTTEPAAGEWSADIIRTVLLWVGGLLLATAALIFAAFAWQRLDDSGRAALLVGTTVLAGGLAAALRDKLRATAEVFAALTLVLLAIDWLALRRAGLGATLDLPTWWAIGAAIVATLALAAGASFAAARWLMVVAATASGLLGVFAATSTAASASVAFAVLATAGVGAGAALHRLPGWAVASVLAHFASSGTAAAAVVATLLGLPLAGPPSLSVATAAAITGLPAVAAALAARGRPGVREVFVGLAATAALAGSGLGWWHAVDNPWAIALTTATAAAAVAGTARLGPVGRGVSGGAGISLLAVSMFGLPTAVMGILGSFAFVDTPWRHSLTEAARTLLPGTMSGAEAGAAVVVSLSIAAAAGASPLRRSLMVPAGLALAAAFAFVPLSVDATVGLALGFPALGAGGGALLAAEALRRGRPASAWAAASAGVMAGLPAFGWSFATEAGTLLFAAGALGFLAAATLITPPSSPARSAFAGLASTAFLGLAAAAATSAGAGRTEAGLVLVGAAAVVLAGTAAWREGIDRSSYSAAVGAAGALLGVGLAWDHDIHRAVAFTVLVPALAAPVLRSDRRGYLGASSVVSVAATWAWLAAADVSLLEAYTLPAAACALGLGEMRRRVRPGVGSWAAYGPAIIIALGPSMLAAITDRGLARPVVVVAAAAVCCWVGAALRLQAPLVLGAIAVVTIAVDTLGPVAAELPRWLTVAAAGALLVWLGATADRRLTQLRAARERLASFESSRETSYEAP